MGIGTKIKIVQVGLILRNYVFRIISETLALSFAKITRLTNIETKPRTTLDNLPNLSARIPDNAERKTAKFKVEFKNPKAVALSFSLDSLVTAE
jgi:hypothetical protein